MMTLQQMEEIWTHCCRHYTSNEEVIAISFDEIRRRYTGSARHYHNLQHIGDLLQLATAHEQHLQDKDTVLFSIFYHDIVYNVFRKDNEVRSAAMAAKRLATLHVPAGKIDMVGDFIKATQTHILPAGTAHAADLAWFLDFDRAVLAAPWPAYETYARQVRKEYRLYPDRMYNPGRRTFLQQTLQATSIFHTAYFREQHEPDARANMQRELDWYR